MKIAAAALALAAAATPLSAQAAPRVARTLSGAEFAALEAVREAGCVDWFSGDTASLHTVRGPEGSYHLALVRNLGALGP
jgi:hypothetical protein